MFIYWALCLLKSRTRAYEECEHIQLKSTKNGLYYSYNSQITKIS